MVATNSFHLIASLDSCEVFYNHAKNSLSMESQVLSFHIILFNSVCGVLSLHMWG